MGPKRNLGGGGTVGLGLAGNRKGYPIQDTNGDPQIADLFFGYAFGYVEMKTRQTRIKPIDMAEAVSETLHVETWPVVASLERPWAITSPPSSVSSFAKTV
jgi:hypothetical protein